jgi:formamidopyrimidine-DNA glycosylase
MPELPEVETVRVGLAPKLMGRTIARVQLMRPNLRIPFPANLIESLEGAEIRTIERRAKYLLMHTNRAQTTIIHLGMSGKMLLHPAAINDYSKHDHVIMSLGDGQMLVFNDARRFGLWTLADTLQLDAHPLLAHLGPEPLADAFDGRYLYAALQQRSGDIKPVIMDQKLVVGVGNIYASEALYMARIHPQRTANSLSRTEANLLTDCIKTVLQAAIRSGGSTLRDYVRSSGEMGYFQHHFSVYGKAGRDCEQCSTPIAQIIQTGRSSFFCPQCQPQKPPFKHLKACTKAAK